MLLEIEKGKKSFGAETIFYDLDFLIKKNDKTALIGRNGAGKTTLLRIMAGQESLDSGVLRKAGKTEIAYLSQTAIPDNGQSAREFLLGAFKQLAATGEKLTELEKKLAVTVDEKDLNEYAKLQSFYQQHDGYNIDYRIANVFTRFGFKEEELDKKLGTFSGGQKTKIAFAELLLRQPDLLLLDEPTNHLDLNTVEWLEEYLRDYPKALVIVSHDRYFIDSICNVTYEIELGQAKRYGGNYSFAQAEKKLALLQQEKHYKNQQEEIARLETLIERFRYKKNKAAFAQSKIKYLEKMDKIEISKTDTKNFKADFSVQTAGGKTVCFLRDFEIGYNKSLAKIDLTIYKGQKIGIIGPNGCGKSTLMKSIASLIAPIGGEKQLGHDITIGYFDQELSVLDKDNDLLRELAESYPKMTTWELRNVLGAFLFSGDDVYKKIAVLSGGEKVRLAFTKLMLRKDNFLLLDEPTNHLDIPAKEALEEALIEYSGTLLFVSHDRYFIATLADSLLVFEDGNFHYFPGTYREYREKKRSQAVAPKTENEVKRQISNPGKTLAKLEKQITKTETKLAELRNLSFQQEYYQDFLKMNQLQREIDETKDELDFLFLQWEEASKNADC